MFIQKEHKERLKYLKIFPLGAFSDLKNFYFLIARKKKFSKSGVAVPDK